MVPLHSVYLGLIDPSTGRARFMSDVEKPHPHEGDVREAGGISRLYVRGLQMTVKALESGDLKPIDAVTGDHGCHILALVASTAKRDLAAEIAALPRVRQVNIKSPEGKPPHEMIQAEGYAFQTSEKLQYLVHAVILKLGTECIEHPDGTMTLTLSAQKIADRAKAPKEIVTRMIIPLRESLNRFAIHYVQSLAVLPRVEVVTNCRGETYQFTCAFDTMKTVLQTLAKEGVHFLLAPYDQTLVVRGPLYVLNPAGDPIDPKTLPPETPIFVIQGFGDLQAVVDYGLFKFVLASIARPKQFEEKDDGLSEEILACRAAGESLPPFRIAHTYADTLTKIRHEQNNSASAHTNVGEL
jgi:hypothetical protein